MSMARCWLICYFLLEANQSASGHTHSYFLRFCLCYWNRIFFFYLCCYFVHVSNVFWHFCYYAVDSFVHFCIYFGPFGFVHGSQALNLLCCKIIYCIYALGVISFMYTMDTFLFCCRTFGSFFCTTLIFSSSHIFSLVLVQNI